MVKLNKILFSISILIINSIFIFPVSGQVINNDDPALRGIDIIEHLGGSLDLDIALTNDKGEDVNIGQYFSDGKPVMLIMAYYECPMLCNLVMNGVTQGASEISLVAGRDYNILTVSIDPTETTELAVAKKKNYLDSFEGDISENGWTFFTATEDQSNKLANDIGFKYYFDEELQQYAHAAVVTILTGDGVISRYLYGIEFKPNDLKLALLEAANGNIGTSIDRILLFCYQYDPASGGYTVMATNVMKLGGVATLIFLAFLIGGYWLRELRHRSRKLRTTQ